MAWECEDCQIDVRDDLLSCPECDTPKTAWTMVLDKTRTFVVGSAKFMLLAGEDPADVVTVVPKAVARALADRGDEPAPTQVLTVRLRPCGDPDLTVHLEVLYEGDPFEELDLPTETPPDLRKDGLVDVPLLFVGGPGSTDGVDLAGIRIVDVGEENEEGFAPSVIFAALSLPSVELPCSGQWREFEFSV